MPEVLIQVIWRRRFSLIWWSLGIVAADALLAVAYPTVRDNTELDKTFAGLPPGVQAALGLQAGAITSPAGYLNSQYFANLLPILLLVFAIGLGAWSIGGDEASGTLELLLSNPIGRFRLALERWGALALELGLVTAVGGGGLIALAPVTGLTRGLGSDRIIEATVATGLLALTFAAVAFAVGAVTGSRSAAISSAAGSRRRSLHDRGSRRAGFTAPANKRSLTLALATGYRPDTQWTGLAELAPTTPRLRCADRLRGRLVRATRSSLARPQPLVERRPAVTGRSG